MAKTQGRRKSVAKHVVSGRGRSARGPSEARSRRARASGGGAPRALKNADVSAKRAGSGKYVYLFGRKTDGNGTMKPLLGGKGANLAEMCRIGLPVPPGFT